MSILNTRRFARSGGCEFEVRASNHVWTGVHYLLIVDGECLAEAQNFWKIPTQRKLEGRLPINGKERHIVVEVKQRWLSTEFSLSIDGEPIPLI